MNMNKSNYIFPNWDAPKKIHALTTTKRIHHEEIQTDLGLKHPPIWLTQVHGNDLYHITTTDDSKPTADGCYTTKPHLACAIRTADCLPILLTNRSGSFVAGLHCGWKGLYLDLICKTVQIADKSSPLIAWIGPGISFKNYEVDNVFFERFYTKNHAYSDAFTSVGPKYLANLPKIAAYQLKEAGIQAIFQSGICSYDQSNDCHSFRRDGEEAGRMTTLIWIEPL
jgi:hypothetical protein